MQNDSSDGSHEPSKLGTNGTQVTPGVSSDFATELIQPERVQSHQDDKSSESAALLDAAYDTLPSSQTSKSDSNTHLVAYFGDYELLNEIARGGMGVVYKARQMNLNRTVAIKMILAGHLASDEDVKRFYTEAEAAANLEHPSIVPVYEIGQHNGQHFFSMGYVDGSSLAERVKEGPLPIKQAVLLTKKVAEAIEYAHSKGVVHRDLKPANILIDQLGEPRVTDFGLARNLRQESGITRTGTVMGTPSYMPPEQAAGKTDEVGPLSDVYSLGAILYCLITGRPPFLAASVMDTLMQVLDKEPAAPSLLNPLIHRDIETICLKSLQKDPAQRYESAGELAADLGRWLNGEPILARAVSRTERVWRWGKRNPSLALACSIACCLAIALAIGGPLVAIRQSSLRREADLSAAKAQKSEALARESEENSKREENRAVVNETRARAAETEAKTQTVRAVDFAKNIQRQMRQESIQRAGELMAKNDLAGAHFALTRAVPDEEETNTAERQQALNRLGAVWNEMPRITQFWNLPTDAVYVDLNESEDRLITVDSNREATLWDTSTGKLAAGPFRQKSPIWRAALNKNGDILATAGGSLGFGGELVLWDVNTGESIARVTQSSTLLYVAFVQSDSFLTLDFDIKNATNTVTLWGIDRQTHQINKLRSGIRVYSEVGGDFDFVALRSGNLLTHEPLRDKTPESLYIFDPTSGEKLYEFDIPELIKELNCIRFESAKYVDTNALVRLTFRDVQGKAIVRLWDSIKREYVGLPLSLWGSPAQVARFGDSSLVTVRDSLGRLMVFDTLSGDMKNQIDAPKGCETNVCFSSDGRFMAIPHADGRVDVWDILDNRAVSPTLHHNDTLSFVRFARDGRQLVVGTTSGMIRLWDFSIRQSDAVLLHSDPLLSVQSLSDGTFETISTLRANRQKPWVQRWQRQADSSFTSHRKITEVPNPSFINHWRSGKSVVANGNGLVEVLDAFHPEMKTLKIQQPKRFVRQFDLSINGNVLGILGTDRTEPPAAMLGQLSLWDATTGKSLGAPIQYENKNLLLSLGIVCFAIDVSGERALFGGAKATLKGLEGDARLLDIKTGKRIGKPMSPGANSIPSYLAFHPTENRALMIAGKMMQTNCELSIWDLETCERLPGLFRCEGWLTEQNGLKVPWNTSPDGRLLGLPVGDQLAILDSSSLERRIRPLIHSSEIQQCVFHPSLPLVATRCKDRSVRVWDLENACLYLPVIGEELMINWVDFDSNGDLLLACLDRKLHIRTLSPQPIALEEHQRISRIYAGREFIASVESSVDNKKSLSDWKQSTDLSPNDANPSVTQLRDWNQRLVTDYVGRSMWQAALPHQLQIYRLSPNELRVVQYLATLYCAAGRFAEGAREFGRYASLLQERNEDEHWERYLSITAWLAAGNREEYAAECKRQLERHRDNKSAMISERIAKLCFLAPECPIDVQDAMNLVERAVSWEIEKPTPGLAPWTQLCHGMGLHRTGKYAEATEKLMPLIDGKETMPVLKNMARAFAAMSLAGLGRDSEAQGMLRYANQYESASQRAPHALGEWLDLTQLSIVLREARANFHHP
jgi:WD40 repeat protein/tRNA A-37 threonylcarbamoyl transferase component Bud32